MWYEVIWNVGFLQGLIHIAIGVLAAIIIVPRILKNLQARRDKRLARELLRQWSGNCISAITFLYSNRVMEEEESLGQVEQNIDALWEEIRNVEREPEESAMIISNAIRKELYRDEEIKDMGLGPERIYQLKSDLVIERSLIRSIVGPMYAKIEIFDIELLPIEDLEMAMIYLEEFSEQGKFTRGQLMAYVSGLAGSMEMFEKYIWKLDNWSRVDSKYGNFTRDRFFRFAIRVFRLLDKIEKYTRHVGRLGNLSDSGVEYLRTSKLMGFADLLSRLRGEYEKYMWESDPGSKNKETRDRLQRSRRFNST